MTIRNVSQVHHGLPAEVRVKLIPLNCNTEILVQILQKVWHLIGMWIRVDSESHVSLEKCIKISILKTLDVLLGINFVIITWIEFWHHVYYVVEAKYADCGIKLPAIWLLNDLQQHLQHRHRIIPQ